MRALGKYDFWDKPRVLGKDCIEVDNHDRIVLMMKYNHMNLELSDMSEKEAFDALRLIGRIAKKQLESEKLYSWFYNMHYHDYFFYLWESVDKTGTKTKRRALQIMCSIKAHHRVWAEMKITESASYFSASNAFEEYQQSKNTGL